MIHHRDTEGTEKSLKVFVFRRGYKMLMDSAYRTDYWCAAACRLRGFTMKDMKGMKG